MTTYRAGKNKANLVGVFLFPKIDCRFANVFWESRFPVGFRDWLLQKKTKKQKNKKKK